MLNRQCTVLICALVFGVATFSTPQRADAGVITLACSTVNSVTSACPKFGGSGLIQIELTVTLTQNVSGLFHTTTGYPGGTATFSRLQALSDLPGFVSPAVTLTGSRAIPVLTTVIDTSGGGLALSGSGANLNTTQFSPYVGVGDFAFLYLPIGGAAMTSASPPGDITWQFLDVFVPSSVSAQVAYTVEDSVPESASLLLFGTGLAGFVARRCRRAKA